MEFLYCLYNEFLLNYFPHNIANFISMITFVLLPFCIIAAVLILVVIFLVLLERKLLALFTQRYGPNRVGPFGLFQTIADAIKLLCKENITPQGADKFLFTLAPLIAFIPIMVIWGLIPYCQEFAFMDFSVNLLLFTVIGMVPLIGILLAGYASNNKFSLIGSIRAVSQVLSYELPLMFVLLSIAVLTSSLNLNQIVISQMSGCWNIFPCFIGFCIVFICSIAELNRCPFDLPEAESELVSGYNTEYSGMKFAFFFLAEYAMMFILCTFIAVVFLGGYLSPFGFYITSAIFKNTVLADFLIYFEQVFWLFLKAFILLFAMIWVRATLPRFKISDLLNFSWKFLLPASFVNLLIICLLKGVC